MSENIHNDDDELLKRVYDNYKEEPSPEIWEKLNARLDSRDATLYRIKFTQWKRIAVVLFFLLGSAAAYELFFKPNTTPAPTTVNTKQSKTAGNNVHQQPSSQHSLPQDNDNKDSLNKAEVSVPSTKNYNNQSPREVYKNTIAKTTSAQPSKQHNANDTTQKTKDIVIEKYTTAIPDQRSSAPDNSSKLLQDTAQQAFDKPLKNVPATNYADKGQHADEPALKKDDFVESNAALPMQQRTDSSETISKRQDATTNTSTTANKQSTIKIKKFFKPQLSFSPYIAIDFSGHKIDDNHHHREPGRNDDEQHAIEHRENNQSSFSAGLLVRYQINHFFSLKSGLVYTNTAIHVNPQILYATSNNNLGTGYKYVSSLGYAYINPSFDPSPQPGDSLHCEYAEQHASYLSIPLMAGYTFDAGKRLTVIPGVGFTTNFFTGSKVETEVKKDMQNSIIDINKLQGMSAVYFSFAADVGLHYQLSKSFSLMLLPSFKYAIIPTTSNHVVKTYPYNAGLGLGFTYKL